MTQHTQGPWEIIWPENKGVSPRIKCDSFGTICRLNDIWPTENGYEENLANARLIAAAPELLEALEIITDMLMSCGESFICGIDEDFFEDVCAAQDAIAKAKGE